MHSFLKAIGFSQLKSRKEVEALIQMVINQASERHMIRLGNSSSVAELSMEFGEGVGITVRGEYDEDEVFHMEHYFPFFSGRNVSTREQVYISKRVDTDAYTGMCDDYRLGVSLIFYLQNSIDYFNFKQKKGQLVHSVTLSALALDGKILLPVEKNERQNNISNVDIHYRSQLIAEAKKGNQEAIDSLTVDDIDLYAMVSKRIKYEDVYSIVDTSFIPYGSESDNYTVLGTILEHNLIKNTRTGEEVYILQLDCNHLVFEVCINKNDLLGEPLPGRRFRGTVWMQGNVDFFA